MIPTGAFLAEMDATAKQPTVAEKFAAIWEKKNAKAARAGGVSLMALSLAACGSSSTTTAVTETEEEVEETPVETTPVVVDTDGDGVADADDAFPNDATETVDTDGDGIGDNADEYPSDATNTPPGTSFEATTAANVFEGGAGNDTFTATNLTLTNADTIRGGDGDEDTLTLTSAAAPASAASIQGVEVINVVSTSLAGITAFDADSTTGATINVSIDRFGNDGTVTIANVEGNAVVAGTDVDDLTLTDVGTTTVDAGEATTLTIDTDTLAAGQTVTITANADLTAELTSDNAAGDTFVINGAVEVDLVGSTLGATDTITAADATIASAELATGATMTAAVAVVDVTTAVDVSEWTVGDIQMSVAGGFDIDGAQNDSSYTVNLDQTGLTGIDGEAGQTGAVTINTAFDLTGVTTTIFTDTVINVSDDVSLGTITATDTITLTGSGDVTVGDTATATTLDASGLTGDLTLTANTGAMVDVLGSTGATTYTTIAGANTFIGQDGDDDVTTGTLSARMAAQMGGGDDTLTLAATAGGGTETVTADMGAGDDTIEFAAYDQTLIADGGDGTDTVLITNGDNLSAQTVTLTNIENISVQDAAGSAIVAQTMTLNAAQAASVDAISILAPTNGAASDDTLAVTVAAGAAETSIDVSGLTVASAVTFTLNGTNAVTTSVVGSTSADTIDAGTAAETITGGAGDDSFVFADSDSTEASMASITDYTGAAAAGDNDTLTIGTTTVLADATEDVSAVGTIFSTTTGTVNAIVTDGMLTLSGLAADVALANTLAEMIDIAEAKIAGTTVTAGVDVVAVAFEFDGNTYVIEGTETGAATDTYTTTTVLELAGVTGMTMDSTAAADTILIA